jgi:mRNA-degrading endonuclease RelE of RelBE toxin-antitoxin system
MSYNVRLSKQVLRQIGRLPGHVRSRAKQRIVALRTEPRPADAKELEGHPDFFRVWVDRDYRLVWQVNDELHLVDIFYAGPKSDDLYAKLGLERP